MSLKHTVLIFNVIGLLFCTSATAQVTQEWLATFNGNPWGLDEHAYAMTTDAAGNVYVTGLLPTTSISINHAITIKYDKFGTVEWEKKFEGTNGQAIAVDGAGNVYVAASIHKASNWDILLIKYSADGDTLWTRTADGPKNVNDFAKWIIINASGNIWIAGESRSSNFSEIMTVIFDPDGNQLANNSYGSGNGYYHSVNAFVSDATGNTYITGYRLNGLVTSTQDVTTIKYNAFGSVMWAKNYDGVGQSYDNGNDIDVDLSGNVYVTGVSTVGGVVKELTVKYSPVGDTVWTRTFSRGGESSQGNTVTTDGDGNIFIAGSTNSGLSNDLLLLKYNTIGDTLWTRYFDGNNTNDIGKSIGIDIAGNVFVGGIVGGEIAILKYSTNGNKLWNQSYKGSTTGTNELISFQVSPSGIATMTGTLKLSQTDNDIETAQFDSSGSFMWESIFQTFGISNTRAKLCAIGKSGNIYITGYGWFASKASADIVTIKYTPEGDTLWTRRYSAGDGEPRAFVVDKRDNVYVGAILYNASGNPDFLLLKYDQNGTLKWTVTYDNGSFDFLNAIAVDDNGNVFITGESTAGSVSDYATIKYDSSGTQQWFPKRYNPNGGTGYNQPFAIAFDKNGNIFVTGSSATIKYNSAGIQQWVQKHSGIGSWRTGTALAVDDSGYVFVGGTVGDDVGSGGNNMIVIKYNSAGDTIWTSRYNSPANSTDIVHALALDRNGNIIVTGASANGGPTYDYDYSTVKFNRNGVVQWGVQYDDGNNDEQSATSLVVDSTGNVYITGSGSVISDSYQLQTTNFKEIATIRYSPTGIEDWIATYRGSANTFDQALDLKIDNLGNIFCAGFSSEMYNSFGDVIQGTMLIKYHQDIPLLVNNRIGNNTVPKNCSLFQNYPNPFNPSTVISYQLSASNFVSLKVYDVIGRVVVTLVNEVKDAGSYEIKFNVSKLSSGIYFYKLTSGDFSEIKKMIVTK